MMNKWAARKMTLRAITRVTAGLTEITEHVSDLSPKVEAMADDKFNRIYASLKTLVNSL
jgi:hypothetical protein